MKKFLKKILIMIIVSAIISMFFVIAMTKDSRNEKIQYLNHLNYDVSLNQDGSMNVVETWDVYVKNTGTLFKTFSLSNYLYGNITDVKVKDLENNLELTEIILLIYIVKIVKYRRINKKENDGIIKRDLKYYSEIPRDGESTPNEAVYLYHFAKEKLETSTVQSQMVASTILNLCLKKIIALETEGENIYISLIGDGKSLKKEEYEVYKLLSEASKSKEKLEIKELNDYAKKHYSNYSIYINRMVNETRNELYNMQYIDKKKKIRIDNLNLQVYFSMEFYAFMFSY